MEKYAAAQECAGAGDEKMQEKTPNAKQSIAYKEVQMAYDKGFDGGVDVAKMGGRVSVVYASVFGNPEVS
jgi:hypothetical protein